MVRTRLLLRRRRPLPARPGVLRSGARIPPASAKFWKAKGDVSFNLGNLGAALDAYERSVQIDDTNRQTWLDYAEALFEARRVEDASGGVP